MNIIIFNKCVGAHTATKLIERAGLCINAKVYMKTHWLSSKLQPLFRQRAIIEMARRNDFKEN